MLLRPIRIRDGLPQLMTLMSLCTALAFGDAAVATQPDVVMDAMVMEMTRAQSELGGEEFPAPYFVSFTTRQTRRGLIVARGGATITDALDLTRQAIVDVRVGDYGFDSSEDAEQFWTDELDYEAGAEMPLDDDLYALRHALWLLTDLRYKQATAAFLRLKGQSVFKVEDAPKQVSHSRAPAINRQDMLRPATFNRARWRDLASALSARMVKHPEIFDGTIEVSMTETVRWITNTEGVRLRTTKTLFGFHAVALSRADDGMLLEHSVDRYGPSEAALGSDAALDAALTHMLAELRALRRAPELGPYSGPALLAPRAAGVFFHEVLGHRLEAQRQRGEDEGQTFREQLGKPILPEGLTVIDDPTLKAVNGVALNGHYEFDDEGVAAQRVVLVDNGILRSFLMGRRPAPGFHASNGHGRASGLHYPTARMANLVVSAAVAKPRQDLIDALILQARTQGKPYGLIISDLAGGSTNTSSAGYQAFKGAARLVYRVDAKTGVQTLVRGVDLVGTPLASLRRIVAAGDRLGVFNGYCGAESGMIPVSTVAPAILFSEIELQRATRGRARPPLLTPPARVTPRP